MSFVYGSLPSHTFSFDSLLKVFPKIIPSLPFFYGFPQNTQFCVDCRGLTNEHSQLINGTFLHTCDIMKKIIQFAIVSNQMIVTLMEISHEMTIPSIVLDQKSPKNELELKLFSKLTTVTEYRSECHSKIMTSDF